MWNETFLERTVLQSTFVSGKEGNLIVDWMISPPALFIVGSMSLSTCVLLYQPKAVFHQKKKKLEKY